jgi:hypothetical protein
MKTGATFPAVNELNDMTTADGAPSMYRLMAFVERLEQLVLYDAPVTAADLREFTALQIGEIDVKGQRVRLRPQFGAVIRRKTPN